MTYTADWVRLALRGAPGAGGEVVRQVVEATNVRDLDRHAALLNRWAADNPGAESNPDYWRDYKKWAIEQLLLTGQIVPGADGPLPPPRR